MMIFCIFASTCWTDRKPSPMCKFIRLGTTAIITNEICFASNIRSESHKTIYRQTSRAGLTFIFEEVFLI